MAVEEPAGPGELDLAELYRRYAPRLRRLCRRRLGDAARAEDASHEALLRAHHAADRFRQGAAVWPWLATIAANVCTDMERRDGRVAYVAQLPDQAGITDPSVEAGSRSRRQLVVDALRSLPLPYRRSVFLHHYAGLSYDEIAEHEGTSVGAVRSRLMRARRMLRVRIEELATARGEWPLPALAPWLRERLTRGRLAFGRLESSFGRSAESAVPYAAALLLAISVGTSGGGLPSEGADPRERGGRATAVGPPQRAALHVSAAGLTRGGARAVVDRVPPAPRVPAVRRYDMIATPKVKTGATVAGIEIPIQTEAAWSCGPEPGPVTAILCDTFDDEITP
jgi:RNA polymerase sigma-70 factor (ECF subfamily)